MSIRGALEKKGKHKIRVMSERVREGCWLVLLLVAGMGVAATYQTLT